MDEVVGIEAHRDPLRVIADEELGIPSFANTGKVSIDIRLVRIAGIACALKRAYELGLVTGHTIARAGSGQRREPG